jgi:acyl dehydratase
MSTGARFHEIPQLVGRKVSGETFTISASQQDLFERATWVDRAYADNEAEEFPETIVEGFFLLSLLDALSRFAGMIDPDTTWGLNYGVDRARFVSPIYFGDPIVPEFEILQVKSKHDGYLVLQRCTLTVEGSERPGMVADWWGFIQQRATTDSNRGEAR